MNKMRHLYYIAKTANALRLTVATSLLCHKCHFLTFRQEGVRNLFEKGHLSKGSRLYARVCDNLPDFF